MFGFWWGSTYVTRRRIPDSLDTVLLQSEIKVSDLDHIATPLQSIMPDAAMPVLDQTMVLFMDTNLIIMIMPTRSVVSDLIGKMDSDMMLREDDTEHDVVIVAW
jgi:hypothetical protein